MTQALSVPDAAARLGVSRQRIHQLIKARKITVVQAGQPMLLSLVDVERIEKERAK